MNSKSVRHFLTAGLLLSAALTGCKTTTTTVVDAHTGRPLAGTQVKESDGTVRYTDAQGTVMRNPEKTARVTREGYSSVDVDR